MVQELESLQKELATVKQELVAKTEECEKLQIHRKSLEQETGELTAQLFEEANKMVQSALGKEHEAQKRAKEAHDEVEALKTEIETLKAVSLRYIENGMAIPSSPKQKNGKYFSKLLSSPMHFRKKSSSSLVDTSITQVSSAPVSPYHSSSSSSSKAQQVNHAFYEEFLEWHENLHKYESSGDHTSDHCCECMATVVNGNNDMNGNVYHSLKDCIVISKSPLLSRILNEDILPCLDFMDKDLSARLSFSIHKNLLSIEPLAEEKSKQKCALTLRTGGCKYKLKIDDSEQWFPVCLAARERITKVCDFLTFVRYVQKGIIKYNPHRIFDEVICHRREMALSRIGPSFSGI